MTAWKALLAGALIAVATPAPADTIVVHGWIFGPTGPDSNPSVYGYDNGGFFGTQFASLGGLTFTATWTGSDGDCYGSPCRNGLSPVTGATITINGITVDLLPYGAANILQAQWHSNGIQVQSTSSITEYLASPPFTETSSYFGSTNSLSTWAGNNGQSGAGGVFYLCDINHQFQTSAYLFISDFDGRPVPNTVIGAGLPGLIACGLFILWRRRIR